MKRKRKREEKKGKKEKKAKEREEIKLNILKGRSHYSDNQSPTSNNHYFWGGCRRLSEVGKCLSMIGDWLS